VAASGHFSGKATMSYVRNVIRSAPRALSASDQRAILAVTGEHVDGFRDHVLFSLALGTALRESELVALDVGDVARGSMKPGELKRGIEPIRTKVQLKVFKRSRHHQSKRPAAVEKEQRVFLPRMVRIKLAKFLAWKKRQHQDVRPGAPLFMSRQQGNRLSTRQVRTLFQVWQKRAGFEELYTFHSLRHTALTNLYAATKDLLLVQKHARHASSSSTEIYAHVSDEDVRRAVEDMVS
jgi:integrase/recombinase XerC